MDTVTSGCQGKTVEGEPCRATPISGKKTCMFHDEEMAERRAAGRREGGRRRSEPRRTLDPSQRMTAVSSLADVRDLLADTINHVRTGQVDPKIANTVGYLASVLVRVFEVGELEERLAAMEAAVRPGRKSASHLGLEVGDEQEGAWQP